MSESMNTAVKSISLDDIGDMQARGPKAAGKNANMMYSPAYKTGPSSLDLGHQSGTQEGTLTNFRPMGEQGGTSSFGTALTSMTRLFGGKFSLQDRARQFLIGGGLLLVIAFGFLWNQSTGTTSTLADLENLVAPLLGEGSIESPSEEPTSELDPVINEVNPTISTQVPTPVPTSGGLENPYWNIPNPLELGDKLGASGQLSPSQEERWRQGLQHPFTWQRFKTVSEMRQARLKGSQTLLNDALGQPKFWTRMEAVLGLAELGEEVDIDSVDKALGQARSTLIQNYFMRFRQNSNGGELYIMRQAIRLADAGSRLVILQNIIQNRNADNDLYLVAATFDPDQNIKSWIKQKLLAKPLDPQVIESFNKISATGEKTPTSTSNLNPPAPGTAPDLKNVSTAPKSNIDEIKVEQLSDKVNVEDVYFINNEEEGAEPLDKTAPPPDDGFEQLEKQ